MPKQKHHRDRFDKIFAASKNASTSFYYRVYEVARRIPKGKVTSYGAIGEVLGMKSSARLVGQAMAAIPDGDSSIPAHRVLNRTGELTAAHKFGGYKRMLWLLEQDGVTFIGNAVDMKKHFWLPKGE